MSIWQQWNRYMSLLAVFTALVKLSVAAIMRNVVRWDSQAISGMSYLCEIIRFVTWLQHCSLKYGLISIPGVLCKIINSLHSYSFFKIVLLNCNLLLLKNNRCFAVCMLCVINCIT